MSDNKQESYKNIAEMIRNLQGANSMDESIFGVMSQLFYTNPVEVYKYCQGAIGVGATDFHNVASIGIAGEFIFDAIKPGDIVHYVPIKPVTPLLQKDDLVLIPKRAERPEKARAGYDTDLLHFAAYRIDWIHSGSSRGTVDLVDEKGEKVKGFFLYYNGYKVIQIQGLDSSLQWQKLISNEKLVSKDWLLNRLYHAKMHESDPDRLKDIAIREKLIGSLDSSEAEG